MACRARLAIDPIAADAELAAFLVAAEGSGAVVTFCGLARPATRGGSALDFLHLDHHPRLTEASLLAIAETGRDRFALGDVLVAHRCGAIQPGETIVFVAASAPHRRAAFEGADYLVDRLKTDAIFWKREEGASGTHWIEPIMGDYSDAARWERD